MLRFIHFCLAVGLFADSYFTARLTLTLWRVKEHNGAAITAALVVGFVFMGIEVLSWVWQ